MLPLRTTTLIAAAASSLCAATATADTLDAALNLAPADADLIIAVPSLEGLSTAVADFSQAAGLDQPWLVDFRASLDARYGLEGLPRDAPLLVVLDGLDQVLKGNVEPTFYILTRPNDYATFANSLGAEDTSGAPTRFQNAADSTMKGFMKRVGEIAVLVEDQEDLADFQPANAGAELLNAYSDYTRQNNADDAVTLIFDSDQIGPTLLELYQAKKAQNQAQIEQQLEAAGLEADAATLLQMQEQLLRTLFDGVSGGFVGLDIGDGGVGIDLGMEVVEGSTFASLLQPGKLDGAASFSTLPGGTYFVAGAVDGGSLDMATLRPALLQALDQVSSDAQWFGPLRGVVEQTLAIVEGTTSSSTAVYPPASGFMGGTFYEQITVNQTRDGAAYQEATRSLMTSVAALMAGVMPEDGAGTSPSFTYEPDAVDLDNGKADLLSIQPAAGIAGPTSMQSTEMLLAVQGDTVVTTSSRDVTLMQRALRSAEGGAGGGLADAASITTGLDASGGVQQPFAVYAVSLDGIAQTFSPLAAMFMGVQINVPEALPATTLVAGTDGQDVAVRFFIPAEGIAFINREMEAFFDAQRAQQQQPPFDAAEPMDGDADGPPPAPF